MSIAQRPTLRLVRPDERAPRPRVDVVRWALAFVATLQVLLGLAQAGGGHVSNESMAWNIALGAAFLSIARAGRCSPGLLAVLGAFVATLLLLSVSDLLSGRVGADRLTTHALLVTGLALVLTLARRRR
jgi:predicted anti-sigma-YlaC factor YlaD